MTDEVFTRTQCEIQERKRKIGGWSKRRKYYKGYYSLDDGLSEEFLLI